MSCLPLINVTSREVCFTILFCWLQLGTTGGTSEKTDANSREMTEVKTPDSSRVNVQHEYVSR